MTTQLDLPTERPSQKLRILTLLRAAAERGICISNVPLDLSYTARNRIGDLRKEGYVIESAPCRVHHHRAAVARYFLMEEST